MAKFSFAGSLFALVRNILLAALAYATIYTLVEVVQTGRPGSAEYVLKHRLKPGEPIPEVGGATFTPGEPPANLKLKDINPHANWFNRPISTIAFKDDYMGPRPDVDTVANLTKLVETCRGSYTKLDKMFDRKACFEYLVNGEKEYFYLPEKAERASAQSPKEAEYLNADNKGNSLSKYPVAKAASKSSLGSCNGPIIPYHVYWTGPASWRLELFTKAYLYTQNLPCSRLWMWLDTDKNPNAIEQMMTSDPLFARFLPFVERGDITLKEWKFPSRLPLPKIDTADGGIYYATPGSPNAAGEVPIAEGLVRDAEGQEWLVLTEKQKTFLPVAVSDAVRFVVLHLHGGAYFDMDVTLLRDMRPLLVGRDHAFAERWGQHPGAGDYNTAVLSLHANSSLSAYLLRGGVRMGMNFHPRIVGLMAAKDGRSAELKMLETALFDPIWWEYDGDTPCTVPCLRDYAAVFKGGPKAFAWGDEWEGYDGLPGAETMRVPETPGRAVARRAAAPPKVQRPALGSVEVFDREALARAEYVFEEDNYPPSNRSLEHFFRGAWAYHVHNQVSYCRTATHRRVGERVFRLTVAQWSTQPQPSSWFDVLRRAHNDFFKGDRTNVYGETWSGPAVADYEIAWKFT